MQFFKRFIKRCIPFFLALVLLIGLMPPVQVKAASIVESGTFGDSLTWSYSDNGLLIINGSGDMPDFTSSSFPWYSYRSSITMVQIGSNVTSIGAYAFYNCSSLTSVSWAGNSVTSIGVCAFQYCSSLSSIGFPSSLKNIGNSAFKYCYALTIVDIPSSVVSIGANAFYMGSDGNITSIILNGSSSIKSLPQSDMVFFDCPYCIFVDPFLLDEYRESYPNYAFRFCEYQTDWTDNVVSLSDYLTSSNTSGSVMTSTYTISDAWSFTSDSSEYCSLLPYNYMPNGSQWTSLSPNDKVLSFGDLQGLDSFNLTVSCKYVATGSASYNGSRQLYVYFYDSTGSLISSTRYGYAYGYKLGSGSRTETCTTGAIMVPENAAYFSAFMSVVGFSGLTVNSCTFDVSLTLSSDPITYKTTTVTVDGKDYEFTGSSTSTSPIVQMQVLPEYITLAGASGTYYIYPEDGSLFTGLSTVSGGSVSYGAGMHQLGNVSGDSSYTFYTCSQKKLSTIVSIDGEQYVFTGDSVTQAPAVTLSVSDYNITITGDSGSYTITPPAGKYFVGLANYSGGSVYYDLGDHSLGCTSSDASYSLYTVTEDEPLSTIVSIDGTKYTFVGDSSTSSPAVILTVEKDKITLSGGQDVYYLTPVDDKIYLGLSTSAGGSVAYSYGRFVLGAEDTDSSYVLYTLVEEFFFVGGTFIFEDDLSNCPEFSLDISGSTFDDSYSFSSVTFNRYSLTFGTTGNSSVVAWTLYDGWVKDSFKHVIFDNDEEIVSSQYFAFCSAAYCVCDSAGDVPYLTTITIDGISYHFFDYAAYSEGYPSSPSVSAFITSSGVSMSYGGVQKIWSYTGDFVFAGMSMSADGADPLPVGFSGTMPGSDGMDVTFVGYSVVEGNDPLTTTFVIDGISYVFTGDDPYNSPLVMLIIAEDKITLAGSSGTYTIDPPEDHAFIGLTPNVSVSPPFTVGTHSLGQADYNIVYTLYSVIQSTDDGTGEDVFVLAAGQWQIKQLVMTGEYVDLPDWPSGLGTVDLSFSSNGVDYSSIGLGYCYAPLYGDCLYYGQDPAYCYGLLDYESGVLSSGFALIYFEESQSVSEEFYKWFTSAFQWYGEAEKLPIYKTIVTIYDNLGSVIVGSWEFSGDGEAPAGIIQFAERGLQIVMVSGEVLNWTTTGEDFYGFSLNSNSVSPAFESGDSFDIGGLSGDFVLTLFVVDASGEDVKIYRTGVLGWFERLFDQIVELPKLIVNALIGEDVLAATDDASDRLGVLGFFREASFDLSTFFGLSDLLNDPNGPFAWLSG